MQPADALRVILPAGLACLAAWGLDWQCERKGLLPPGFAVPWRRGLAGAAVAGVLWLGVTSPLGMIGKEAAPLDFTQISTPQLFLLHVLMLAAGFAWFFLGFAGVGAPHPQPLSHPLPSAGRGEPPPGLESEQVPSPVVLPPSPGGGEGMGEGGQGGEGLARRFAEQFGLVAPDIPREIGLGVLLGIAAWVVVLVGVMAIGMALLKLAGEDAIPKQPPAMVMWIAALPFLVRAAISLSAGIVEEWFFRGFLQPRMGILLSTGLFVLAHFAYGQPFMLIGITLLSLIYALLVRQRQTIWPAMAAHALFDGVQLLVVIPGVLKLMQSQVPGPAGPAALLGFW
jgi:membrane protease YdiL (CAAX protease family)